MASPDFRFAAFDALDAGTFHDLLKLRFDVFVLEQRSFYPEIDGRDPEATHLIAAEGRDVVGCLRMLDLNGDGPVSIGRVAVRADRRGAGLGGRMMDAALDWLATAAPGRPTRLGAQTEQRDFYARRGFVPCSAAYDDGGIPHVDMVRSPT